MKIIVPILSALICQIIFILSLSYDIKKENENSNYLHITKDIILNIKFQINIFIISFCVGTMVYILMNVKWVNI
jgi:hypothetical protein